MSSPNSSFRTVMRGYDPAEVDAHIETLKNHLKSLREEIADLEAKVSSFTEPNFAHLGDRVGQMLTLAAEESATLRKQATKAADTERTNAADAARRLRKQTDEEVAALIAEAEAKAKATRDDADAAWQAHEAKVKQAEEDFALADAKRQEQARTKKAEAEAEAIAIVDEARASAERLRTEAEREVAEIAQRRDSITAQLTNVRQVLASLTGEAQTQEALQDASTERS